MSRSEVRGATKASRGLARSCGFPECMKTAKPGGFCISHGGGKKCAVEGCTTSVVSRGFCVAHGGGKRCQHEGCTKSAQTGGFCWIHGGGKKCGVEGCVKRAQSGGACISHGGGKRCRIEGCNKVVQYEGLCVGHGGYRKCLSMNCAKKALPSGYCQQHGGNTRCKRELCPNKSVHGGFCAVHRSPSLSQSPREQMEMVRGFSLEDKSRIRSSSMGGFGGESPSLRRMMAYEGPTISPIVSGVPSAASPRDWSHAIAEFARPRSLPGVEEKMISHRPRLPTVRELQRVHSLERPHLGQGKPEPSLARIAPLLSAAASVEMGREQHRSPCMIERENQCISTGCSRFAKVNGLCLIHHTNHRPPEQLNC